MATAEKVLQFSSPQIAGGSTGFSGLLASILGCRHRNVSRPFTRQGQTFRSCLSCGARKRFDLGTWQDRGGFFHASV